MAAPTLFTLPPHIQDAIARLAATEAAPEALRTELRDALAKAPGRAEAVYGDAAALSAASAPSPVDEDKPLALALPESPPPLVDAEVLEKLAVWSASEAGRAALTDNGLGELRFRETKLTPDHGEYSHIALVAGAEVYLPPKQRALLRSAEAEDTRAEKVRQLSKRCDRADHRRRQIPSSPRTCPRGQRPSAKSTVPSGAS